MDNVNPRSLVTTEHHPTMRYLIYNCHLKVMSNSPKMGHLPIPVNVERLIGGYPLSSKLARYLGELP